MRVDLKLYALGCTEFMRDVHGIRTITQPGYQLEALRPSLGDHDLMTIVVPLNNCVLYNRVGTGDSTDVRLTRGQAIGNTPPNDFSH